jgi:hypothetical protein
LPVTVSNNLLPPLTAAAWRVDVCLRGTGCRCGGWNPGCQRSRYVGIWYESRTEEGQGARVGGGGGPGGGGGRMPGMGLGGNGPNPGGQNNRADRRYSITSSASAHNIFNVVNLAPPTQPLAGRRAALATLPFSASPLSWRPAFSPTAPRCGFQFSGDLQFLGAGFSGESSRSGETGGLILIRAKRVYVRTALSN